MPRTPLQRPGHQRRGNALVASLLIVMLIAGLGAGLIQVQSSMMRRQEMSIDQTRALYIAEAGLSESFLALIQGRTGNIGTPESPAVYDNGVFFVEAEEQPDGNTLLTSTGLVGRGRFTLSVVVKPMRNPVGSLGLFANSDLVIHEGAHVDGYDPNLGTYASQAPGGTTGAGARVRCNGDIEIRNSFGAMTGGVATMPLQPGEVTTIHGHVRPGPNGIVTTEPGAVISGSVAPAQRMAELPPVLLPDMGTLGVLQQPTPESYLMGPGELWVDTVNIPQGVDATLVGPVTLVTKYLTVERTSSLKFDATEGPITVYVMNEFRVAGGGSLEHLGGAASKITIFMNEQSMNGHGTPPTVDLRNCTGEFHGTLYAPTADVVLPSTLRWLGGVIADSLQLEAGAHFTYDKGLAKSVAGIESPPELRSWVVDELPDEPIVRARKSPFQYIRDHSLQTKPASRSALEDSLRMVYQDMAGQTAIYHGDPETIDWDQVKVAYRVQWVDPDTGAPLEESALPNNMTTDG